MHAILAAEPDTEQAPSDDSALDADYRSLLAAIGHETTTVDQMVERSGLTAEAVSSMLLLLELQGFVEAAAGGYARTAKRP